MKTHSLIVIFLLCFAAAFAQTDKASLLKQYEGMSSDDISNFEKLKSMGASPEEIQTFIEAQRLKQAKKKGTIKKTFTDSTRTTYQDTSKLRFLHPDSLEEKEKAPPANIFGQEFFRNKDIRLFDKAREAKAPENYVLSVGDEISISVWGFSDYNEAFTIENDGSIQPSETGKIYLKGLTFADAKTLITNKFSGVLNLRNSKIDVALVYSRVITVNVVGEVFNPGSYTIPGINTAFNALMAANGPTDGGSVRKIYVKRGGKTIRTLDVYQFMFNQDGQEDFFLEDNDYVVVPPAEKIVTIAGEVNRPFKYELVDKEDVSSLIRYAGGLTPVAFTRNLQVARVTNNKRNLIDISLDSLKLNKKTFELYTGDSVMVRRLPDVIENYVEARGVFAVPGKYAFKPGQRISDLVKKAEGVLDDAHLGRAYLIRQDENLRNQYIGVNIGEVLKDSMSPGNYELKRYDVLLLLSKRRFIDPDSISVFGSVRNTGSYLFGEGLTVKDAIFLAGGFKKEAANNRIEISRLLSFGKGNSDSASRVIIKSAQVSADLSIEKGVEEFRLQPYDQVFVRTIPQFDYQKNVTVIGEVNYPGTYSLVSNGEKITDLLVRAGGVTSFAFPEGSRLHRMQDSIGYLFLNLKEVLQNSYSPTNYVMKEGDTLFVPKVNELVKVKGAINYPSPDSLKQINAPYVKGKRAGYYIRNYGIGYAKGAKRNATYVELAGGFIRRTASLGFIRFYPRVQKGATVHVLYRPNKIKKDKEKSTPVDWNKTIESLTVKATAILTLLVLVSKL